MTSSKLVKVLCIVAGSLAFILLAVVLLRRSKPAVFPFAASIDSAESIMITAQGMSVQLIHSAGGWDVRESTGPRYRADAVKVKTLAAILKQVQLDDVISERRENAADFEVNVESATQVTLYGTQNQLLVSGLFGKLAPAAYVYYKNPSDADVYLARGTTREALGPATAARWRDDTLLSLSEDQVMTVFIEAPGIKSAFARSSDTWSLNGRVVDPAPVWGMVGVLSHLKSAGFLNGQTPAHLTLASVIVQLKDGTTHTLHIGRKDPKTSHYPVALDADPTVYAVPQNSIDAFLRR